MAWRRLAELRSPDPEGFSEAHSALLREALLARADAEAAQVRADDAREEAERGRARIQLLAEAGRRMAESMDWESVVQAIARSGVPAVADWTSLAVVENDALRIVAVAHSDPERERLAWELVERHQADLLAATGPVIRSGELALVEDLAPEVVRAAAQDAEDLRLFENLNVRHYAIAPLATPAGVIGALMFVLGDSGRRFAPEDLELITSLAARAALHIHNARLYSERSHIAEVLQTSLRPRDLPAIAGVEVAARFMAAGDNIEVGGDFYDVFPSGDRAWTAIVGDVTGKGPEAAAVTALARHTLRTAALLNDDPSANLALLNQALSAEPGERRLCTVFYLRLCPGDDGVECRFANAGHPAPLVLGVDGRVTPLNTGRGPLAGAFESAHYAAARTHLAPGELILMYTDGVTEVRRGDAEFGERDLAGELSSCAGRAAEEVVDALERRALELQDGRPLDDIALLAIRADP